MINFNKFWNKENNLAYLMGVYFGDGHIYYKKTDCRTCHQFIIVSEDLDLCEICSQICFDYFGKTGNIKFIKNSYYAFVICDKNICNFLLYNFCNCLEYYNFTKLDRKSKLPIFLTKDEEISFLIGLMDSDGWISTRKNGKYIKREIGFKNTSLLSPDIYRMMNENKIKCGKINHRMAYRYDKKNKPYYSSCNTPQICGHHHEMLCNSFRNKVLQVKLGDKDHKKNDSARCSCRLSKRNANGV